MSSELGYGKIQIHGVKFLQIYQGSTLAPDIGQDHLAYTSRPETRREYFSGNDSFLHGYLARALFKLAAEISKQPC